VGTEEAYDGDWAGVTTRLLVSDCGAPGRRLWMWRAYQYSTVCASPSPIGFTQVALASIHSHPIPNTFFRPGSTKNGNKEHSLFPRRKNDPFKMCKFRTQSRFLSALLSLTRCHGVLIVSSPSMSLRRIGYGLAHGPSVAKILLLWYLISCH
jgi:hypothetical protein